MIFPDNSIHDQICPLCKHSLTIYQWAVCTSYRCNKIYSIDCRKIPHYEFIRFKDESVLIQYIILPFYVTAQQRCSTIAWLTSSKFDNYSSKDIAIKDHPIFLVQSNIEEIKNKLKLYVTFS
jgi:hypothetical protein